MPDIGAAADDGRLQARAQPHGKADGAIGRWALRGLTVAILCLVAFLLYRIFRQYSLTEVMESARAIPAYRLALAAAFAAGSYLCLTVFDYLALRAIGADIGYPRAALTSFVSLSIGHNVGLAALSSGAIRYRFYSRWGLDAGDVAKVIIFCAITVGLGLAGLGGLAMLIEPELARQVTRLEDGVVVALGIACLGLPAAYLTLAACVRRPIVFRRWSIEMPALPIAAAQAAIGPINFACVAGALHQTIAGVADVAYPSVAAAYVIANATSLVAHVPGGLGVIEGVVLFLLPGKDLIGALLAFRLVYFFVPLLLGGSLFALSELLAKRHRPGLGATLPS